MGFFFAPYYYAGYGKLGTGIVMGLCALVPFVGLIIAIFGGIKARSDLPIGEQKFNWINVVILFVIVIVVAILFTIARR